MDKWTETVRISRRARCLLSQIITQQCNNQIFFYTNNGTVSIFKSVLYGGSWITKEGLEWRVCSAVIHTGQVTGPSQDTLPSLMHSRLDLQS